MMKWKLYYGDGSTFSDADGDWIDAPALNVQALVVEDEEVGYELNEGSDGWLQNYVWWPEANRPWGVDSYGSLDFLVASGVLESDQTLNDISLADVVAAGMKIGRSIDTPVFKAIHARAAQDDYFPTKSARTRKERRD